MSALTRNTSAAASGSAPLPRVRILAAVAIVALTFVIMALPGPAGLSAEGKTAVALMLAAVLAWAFEVLPIAVASVLFTVLTVVLKIMPLPRIMAHFATPTVFFVFAMFCISIAFQNSGLSRRIVLWISLKSRGKPKRLLFYMMMASAPMSMILADIPVTAMMLPVALILLRENGCKPGVSSFGRALMLGLPIAALIGGVGTPAGSAMNMLTITLLQSTAGIQISFLEWSAVGVPMVLAITPLAWWIVIKVFPPEIDNLVGLDRVEREYRELGPLNGREILFLVFLLANILIWVTDRLHGIPLPVAAVLGASLFALPGLPLISWERDKNKVGWDVLLLIGAANALGMTMWEHGAAAWLADACLGGVAGLPVFGVIAVISVFTVAVHLLIPVNTAIVAVLLPALAALAGNMGVNPAVLAIPMGFSVSAAFLLPLDPVPLITFPAGYYKMYDMFKPGVFISVAWVAVMCLAMLAIAAPLGLL